jgi:hypothetical protein
MSKDPDSLLIFGPNLEKLGFIPKFSKYSSFSELISCLECENEVIIVDDIVNLLKTWDWVGKKTFNLLPLSYTQKIYGIAFKYAIQEEIIITELHLAMKKAAKNFNFNPLIGIYNAHKKDKDDDKFSYPYLFKPPSPPDDFDMASRVQLENQFEENDNYEEICQYCGEKLTKEEQSSHNCRKKP